MISGLAVQGLDTVSTGWADPSAFTPKLSAIVTLSRALVIYLAWSVRESEIQVALQNGLDIATAQAEAIEIYPQVQNMVQQFMCLTQFNGKPTPMARILHMRTFGLKISFNTKSIARVSWRDGYNEICIDQTSFTMTDLRTVVHGLHETCRARLVHQLMFLSEEEQLPKLELRALFDNPAELVEGWSFFQDRRNTEAFQQIRKDRWLWKRMLNEDSITNQLLQGDPELITSYDQLHFNPVAVEDYFRTVKQFKEELIVLCHLTAGAPARGPELLSVMHENGVDSRAQRGVFLDNGMVELVTSYHKGYSLSQRVKIIHRYLPQEVGELVVFYLWLVEPFLQHLQQLTRGQVEFSSYLWEPEPEKLANVELEADLDYTNEDSSEDGSIHWSDGGESGHHEYIPPHLNLQPLNVDGFWSTNRLKRVMKRECNARVGVAFSPSQWRQVYLAIQRVHMQSSEATELLDQLYLGKTIPSQQTQSAHSSLIEDNVYGILATENPLSTFTLQRQFRKLSQMWH